MIAKATAKIGLADNDAPRCLHAPRKEAVLARHRVREQGATHGGRESADRADVLDRLRHAVQPASALAAGELGVAGVCLSEQSFGRRQINDGVEPRIEPRDTLEVSRHYLTA